MRGHATSFRFSFLSSYCDYRSSLLISSSPIGLHLCSSKLPQLRHKKNYKFLSEAKLGNPRGNSGPPYTYSSVFEYVWWDGMDVLMYLLLSFLSADAFMMDHPRSISGGGEENVGIPDDLRCKRSDGKQWRCTAMSMPDKTVCEKHYIQAKKRAANSAMRASMKKAKRKSLGESDIYLESKSDDMDLPLSSQFVRSFSGRSSLRSTDDLDRDGSEYEDSRRSYRTPPTSAVDSDRSRPQKMFEISPTSETSDGSSESSDDTGGQPCHQCRSSNRGRVIWCLKCDRRGYCENCISTWYSDIPIEEVQRVCPACRGTCSCRVCMRGDNLIKARIREIPAKDKLQYLYCLLSAVLPIVKRIHSEQCSEVELEKRLRGNEIDLARTKLNADEQMCWIPIIDYHRHCTNCSYDLCLSCCNDIREASKPSVKEETNPIA
ncbi:UNVERIFIED_CONTAM: Lysine-specific demethylase [Sesamum angustifolium]|uniref:Lysine-specific demethylase n=1 Tax=Sesamum angustifolium TaxID=2727405 RepID=A0AAW2KUN9_9LAMI